MGGFGSIIQTASQALTKRDARRKEDEDRASAREMETLRRALLQAQIGKMTGEAGQLQSTARAYIQQYPELASFAENPGEVIHRGRVRDQEGLTRGRPVAPYPVVDERGNLVMVERPRPDSNISPIRQGQPQGVSKSSVETPEQPRGTESSQEPTQPPVGFAPRQGPGVQGTGVRAFRPGLITPTQGELDAAQWAPGVMQGFTVIRDTWRSNPRAIQEAVPFLAGLDITASLPGIGNAINGAMRSAAQQGLSPEAQRVVQGFLRWTASRVFATGGKQLTQNEIRAAIGQYMPAVNEDPATSEQRLVSMAQDATNVLMGTGRAYPRIKANLIAAGAPDLGEFDPYTQTFTGKITFQDLLGAAADSTTSRRSRYGYQRP